MYYVSCKKKSYVVNGFLLWNLVFQVNSPKPLISGHVVMIFSPCFDAKNCLEFCPNISNTSSVCQALSLKRCMHRSVVGFKLNNCLRLKTGWIPHKGQFFIVNLEPLGREVMPSGRMMPLPSFSREDGRRCCYLPVFVNTVEWCRYLPGLWTL